MKKIAVFLLFTLLFVTTSLAQSFRLDVEATSATVTPGESVVFKGYVHNTSDAAEVIKMVRKTQSLPDGWKTTLCFGNSCYPDFVDEPDPVSVEAADSVFFDITFNTDENPGSGEVWLVFENLVSGEKDSLLFTVETETPPPFTVEPEATTLEGKPGESFVMKGYIHNRSNETMVIKLTRVENSIPEDWTTTLCFGSNCYPSFVDQPDPVAVNAGDSLFFDITFNTGAVPDTGKALLRFEDLVSGYKDSLWFHASTLVPAAIKLGQTVASASGMSGDTFELGGYVYNLTDSLITVNLVRFCNNLPDGWTSSICFDVCVSPAVDTVTSVIAPMDSLPYTLTVTTQGSEKDSGEVCLKFYAVGAYDTLSQNFNVTVTPTAIDESPEAVNRDFRLFGNFPNPFNPQTTIRYRIERTARVKIDIFTVNGQQVMTLLDRVQKSGYHEVMLNAEHLSSGVYYYRLKTPKHVAYGKMILLK